MSENSIYKAMYYKLFNFVSDAIGRLNKGDAPAALALLINAQQTTEEMCVSQDE